MTSSDHTTGLSSMFKPISSYPDIDGPVTVEAVEERLRTSQVPDLSLLRQLSTIYPNIQAASTEIINLTSILALPKGSSQYISDLHGEFEAVDHILRSASGNIREKIETLFRFDLSSKEKNRLATLIYYPDEKLPLILKELDTCGENTTQWYHCVIYRLIKICREVSHKYSRSKLRKALPTEFAYVMMELITPQEAERDKVEYYSSVIQSLIDTGCAPAFISSICGVIQALATDKLYVVGDIYDRGPGAERIMDRLKRVPQCEIAWGNHDLVWIGAACGSDACIANVVRIALRYNNLKTLERGYGINLLPLSLFAMKMYADDDCAQFAPRLAAGEHLSAAETRRVAQCQKALAIIQFKVEHDVILRNPAWGMEDRDLLHRIDMSSTPYRVTLPDGSVHELSSSCFPTIDPENPYQLTPEEKEVVLKLRESFMQSRALQEDVHFMFEQGALYIIENDNLLIHGGIPVKDDGEFLPVQIHSKDHVHALRGRELYDECDRCVRDAFYLRDMSFNVLHLGTIAHVTALSHVRSRLYVSASASEEHIDDENDENYSPSSPPSSASADAIPTNESLARRQRFGRDLCWWLWCGPSSPLFGRDRMATFENYFIRDATARREIASPYYKLRERKDMCQKWLSGFGMQSPHAMIISGHTPVKATRGESPVKAELAMICIDGGFSYAYQSTTGIAGYTLINSSHGLILAAHLPFPGRQLAIEEDREMASNLEVVLRYPTRRQVRETDTGRVISRKINDLKRLVDAYRLGILKQDNKVNVFRKQAL